LTQPKNRILNESEYLSGSYRASIAPRLSNNIRAETQKMLKENMSSSGETDRLDSLAADAGYGTGTNRHTVEYSFRIFQRYIQGKSILEIGPAEGIMTDMLVQLPQEITVIEGAKDLCENLQIRHPDLNIFNILAEEFFPQERYDNIVLGHVLEHVDDPIAILASVRKWLAPNGIVLAAVPNSNSLHRQAAVLMGMLKSQDELNETDIKVGHRRVYNSGTLKQDFLAAGLDILKFGGYWLKPVSNAQIEADWSQPLLTTYMKLGEEYPEIAAVLYVVARPKNIQLTGID
jgi:2-polyprenyl-3-methyl-5-hydroxy-6-metoxy-1,4-benzoquinol methylase